MPMSVSDFYEDYLAIKNMKSEIPQKVRMMNELFRGYSNHWRVVGITANALHVFNKHEFRRVSKMGINRSHIPDRSETYRQMLASDMEAQEWWNFFIHRDRTILATASENKKNRYSKVIKIDPSEGRFVTNGYSWKHNIDEQKFLKNLFKNNPELLEDPRNLELHELTEIPSAD